MEVGDDEDYHFAFDKKEGVVHIPTEIPALEKAFALYHDKLNCFIVEPLLQGAGGMKMYDISFLKRARELCDEYGVLLIFDEVATGLCRTGIALWPTCPAGHSGARQGADRRLHRPCGDGRQRKGFPRLLQRQ